LGKHFRDVALSHELPGAKSELNSEQASQVVGTGEQKGIERNSLGFGGAVKDSPRSIGFVGMGHDEMG
jgi:hypothetical protein